MAPAAPASDNARLRQGAGGVRPGAAAPGRGDRRRRAFMSTSMKRLAVSTRDSIPPGLRCVSFHGWPPVPVG